MGGDLLGVLCIFATPLILFFKAFDTIYDKVERYRMKKKYTRY